MGNSNSSDARHAAYLKEEADKSQSAAIEKASQAAFYAHLDELRAVLGGKIILPTDAEEYTATRNRAFNQDQRGYPLMIVRVTSTSDVSATVKFIRKYEPKESIVCVACGCHSSHCMVTDAIVIDLMQINETFVDVENKRITVGGGAYLRAIDRALEPENLATPVGTYPETGVGGLTLAGGYGWLSRLHGWTIDNFLEAEVVLANGDVVIANDENEHRELIWGLRGGGGNFGIVTKFIFKTYDLPPYIYAGSVVHLAPLTSTAKAIFRAFDNLYQDLPVEVTGSIVLPAGAPVVPTTWTYFGGLDNPRNVPALAKAAKLGGWVVLENSIKPKQYHKEVQTLLTPHQVSGHIYQTICAIGDIDEPLPDKFIDDLLNFTRLAPDVGVTKAMVVILTAGGAATTKDHNSEHTCISPAVRRARYFAIVEAYWDPALGPAGKEGARAWARHAHNILSTVKQGEMKYAPDEVRHVEPPSKVYYGDNIEGFSPTLLRKLGNIKGKYDPDNFFRQNVNIHPHPLNDAK